jgi:hypothetical protein
MEREIKALKELCSLGLLKLRGARFSITVEGANRAAMILQQLSRNQDQTSQQDGLLIHYFLTEHLLP